MKKILTVAVVMLVVAFSANAQDYKKFRVGLGLGYAKASGEGAKGGVLISVEPGYRVSDQLLVNLRWESAAVVRGTVDANSADIDVAAIGSFSAIGQYYFMDGSFRPFAGAGPGMFTLAAVSVSGSSGGGSVEASAAANKLGGVIRAGFDAGHFTFCLDYNLIPKTEAVGGTTEFKNSYIGFRIGGFFGGGRK